MKAENPRAWWAGTAFYHGKRQAKSVQLRLNVARTMFSPSPRKTRHTSVFVGEHLKERHTVLAAAIGIDRLAEGNVGRVIAGDHALRALFGDAGLRAWRFVIQQRALPAVVLGVVADAFEAAFRIGGGAAALVRADGGKRRRWRELVHQRSVARGDLSRRDILAADDPAHTRRTSATL